jgi:hypothetical protein
MIPNIFLAIPNIGCCRAPVLCASKKIKMKMKRFATLVLLLCALSVQAQDQSNTQEKLKTRLSGKLAIKVEYFGELVLHPGMAAGMEYTLVQNQKVAIHWDASLGGYWHRWNHTAAFLKTSVGSRFAMGPAFADVNLGVGYMHSWAAGVLYQRAEDGGVELASNKGNSHFMPGVSILLGWNGGRRTNRSWMIYIGPEVYLQSAFNHTFLPHVAARVGFTYKLKQA